MLNEQVRSQIESSIKKSKVVLFMKGNKHFPQCGFSAQVVQILKELGTEFETVNVLQDAAISRRHQRILGVAHDSAALRERRVRRRLRHREGPSFARRARQDDRRRADARQRAHGQHLPSGGKGADGRERGRRGRSPHRRRRPVQIRPLLWPQKNQGISSRKAARFQSSWTRRAPSALAE